MSNPISQPREQYLTLGSMEELKAGMVIAEDVINERGNVLIAAGFVVDNEQKLRQFLNLHRVETLKVRVPSKSALVYPAATRGSTLTTPETEKKKPAGALGAPPAAKKPLTPGPLLPAEPRPQPTPEPTPRPEPKPEPTPRPLSAGIDPAMALAEEEEEEERRTRQRRMQETKKFQDRYYEQRETLKSDFERIVQGQPITRDELEVSVVNILQSFDSIINVFQLVETIKKDSRDLFAHYYHVTLISHYLGTWLELTPAQMEDLTISALLHDIGKEQLPPDLVLNQQNLTEEETTAYQEHVIMGYEMVKKYDFITRGMMQAILLHHERIDGSGYPLGMKGDKIPILAKIVAVADVYNTLTMASGKDQKKTPFEAVQILERDYMDKLDPRILYVFLHRIGNCFLGQEVKLNDQREGEIIFVPKVYVYRPIIKIKPNNQLIDLSDPKNKHVYIHSFY